MTSHRWIFQSEEPVNPLISAPPPVKTPLQEVQVKQEVTQVAVYVPLPNMTIHSVS